MKLSLIYEYIALLVSLITVIVTAIGSDAPCAPRAVRGRSVVCVCNATYCDHVTRETPPRGSFVFYTTSKSGSRFQKGFGVLQPIDNCLSATSDSVVLVLNPEKRYQTIEGFGGAVTDSVGIIWKLLPETLQKHLINSYFGRTGIGYNLVRLPIGASDFSTRTYSLDDCDGDVLLKNFSLALEDYRYKIPLVKEITKVSEAKVNIFCAPWSSPRWMKEITSQNPTCGFLKHEHFQTYANYLLKFVESYEAEGIHMWALSTGNEPSLANLPSSISSCLGWPVKDLGEWIVNNLGPTVRNGRHKNLKILAIDDQRYALKLVFEPMVSSNPKVLDYIDGVAVHYYADSYVSPEVLADVGDRYSKLVLSTEASAGYSSDKKVDRGSWDRAERYAKDIIQDLINNVVGWVDWNIWLNAEGGPNVDKNYVDSPIIVDEKSGEFLKQPMYYIIAHFSKFIPKHSRRIEVRTPTCDDSVHSVGFLTPSDTIVLVICNRGTSRAVILQLRNKEIIIYLEANSISTIEFLNE